MGNFFVKIFDYFNKHKLLMWLLITSTTILMTIASLQVKYVEDITNFFPKSKEDVSLIFKNLKSKDKIAVMFISTEEEADIDRMIDCAKNFKTELYHQKNFSKNAKITLEINDSIVESMSSFVYNHLPVFLDDNIYQKLDSISSPEAITAKMEQNYNNLSSFIGGYISDYIYKDPLGLGGDILKELQNQGNNFQYSIIDNYIFSSDEQILMAYIDPSESKNNEKLIRMLDYTIENVQSKYPNITIEYFGAPAVAVCNARQIKNDCMLTLTIAILIVLIFITLAFRNKFTVFYILMPVFYGAIFALSIIYLIKGEISLIAVGSGSIIFGIALSYSIHILSHTNHCNNMRQLIRELAFPLTVGSFTTIGAFFGLLFTNSKMLQDFGLFSALTLIGTTLFALIFLPHFIKISKNTKPSSRLLNFVEKISSVRLDKKKALVIGILLLTLVCTLFFSDVKFDSNMMNLNFMPDHLEKAENRLNSFNKKDTNSSNVMFIASSENKDEAVENYMQLCSMLDSFQNNKDICSYSSVNKFIVSQAVQEERLLKWKNFWTKEKQNEVVNLINSEANKMGFEENAYADFNKLIQCDFQTVSYNDSGRFCQLFPDWISMSDALTSFVAQVKIDSDKKAAVYNEIINHKGIIAADRTFFASKMAEDVNHNFYLILYISGILIFFALLISYGRFELTLMAFLPMFISWVMILGIMSLLGIQFNIVTIILSSFIFGIGDDFSIFVMDGLQNEYKNNTQVLSHHKSAIFFSAFTVIVGMGALIFAKHPAMNSLGLISLIGILVVVIVSYTVQPFIYRLLITNPTKKGGFPYTIWNIINTFLVFLAFVLGCIVIQLMIIILYIIPLKRKKKLISKCINWFIRNLLKAVINKTIYINPLKETFETPSVIIANHQSFIDILIMLSLNSKIVMATNSWVWNSPFFGGIVRYLGFYNVENGNYENLVDELKGKIKEGYSIVVFPEGTRSSDCSIKRFHKGAFYLAEQLNLDIIPVLLYGNGLVISKDQPFYKKKGFMVTKILPRISPQSTEFGEGYKKRTKNISHYFREEYIHLYDTYNRANNHYFRDAIIKNYIYKGPILEWYMRIKLRMEKWYDQYDRILPRKGYIVDLGCGYGAMSYMMMMLSKNRSITGVDYDEEKITLAKHCFLKNEAIDFITADVRQYDIPQADAFVISDVLHYIDNDAQENLITKCIQKLNCGGVIVIRDGDTSEKKRHQRTEKTEKWSTKIVKFNKTDGSLCFFSKEMLMNIAEKNNLNFSIANNKTKSSNTLYIIKKTK